MRVYMYNADGYSTGYKDMSDAYQPKAGETLIQPDQSLHSPKFDGTTWAGLTKEEYDKQHPPKPSELAELKNAVNQLGLIMAKSTVQINQLKQELKNS